MTDEIVSHFLEVHKKFNKCVKEFHEMGENCGFNQSEFTTMIKIAVLATNCDFKKNPVNIGVSMKALSRELSVSPAMVTKTVTILEKKGYVRRVSDNSDRRGVKVYITQLGNEEMLKDKREKDKFFAMIFSAVGEEKSKLFLNLLDEFLEAADNVAEQLKKERKETVYEQNSEISEKI